MTYSIRFHPVMTDDLDWIAEWISDFAGTSVAADKLDEIAQGRKGIVVFAVDDDVRAVLIYALSYGGAERVRRSRERSRGTVTREFRLLLRDMVG